MTEIELKQFKDEIKEHVSETIRSVVNGKIDKLDKKLTEYIADDTRWKEEASVYRKEQIAPVVNVFQNGSGFFKVVKWVTVTLVTLAASATAYLQLKKLF